MNGSWTPERLLDFVGQMCNGTLRDEDGRALDALLHDDAVARRWYTDYMWLHASLYSENGTLTERHAADSKDEARPQRSLLAPTLDLPMAAIAPRRLVRRSPAGVAAIHRRIRLQILDRGISARPPALRADDPGRDGLAQPERISDRKDQLADAHTFTVAEGQRDKIRRIDFQHGDVCGWIAPQQAGLGGSPIGKLNLNVRHFHGHVMIGDDVTLL